MITIRANNECGGSDLVGSSIAEIETAIRKEQGDVKFFYSLDIAGYTRMSYTPVQPSVFWGETYWLTSSLDTKDKDGYAVYAPLNLP